MNWTRGHPIGHGSTATVSVGKSHASKDVFAVKSMELSKSEILQREQRVLSSLSSPHIVHYKGCDVTNENGKFIYNLFMEYIAGGSLSDAIQNQGCLKECLIGSYTRDILLGMDYLHGNGLVHCDIKGGNILIGDERAKIADLGCAKFVDELNPISGTPLFMAPEVARGEEQSFPADIWALGCTIIEMATGSPPWKDVKVNDPVAALYRIAFSGDVPEIPSCLSEEGRDFLEKCLRSDPKERWTTTQLLAHPFIQDMKQVEESVSNSPTSILDQGFWDSMEESETPRDQTQFGCSSSSAQRLGRISSSAMPNWDLEEDWITIRSNEKQEDDYVSGVASSSGSESGRFSFFSKDEEMELCETSVSEIDLEDEPIDSFSQIRSNNHSCSEIIGDCISVNLKFEIQREFVSFNEKLLGC